ncbi:MAG: ClC family H(+)/Cl(-) exchange transporter [Coriobacteriales bacterium]|jgi:H+/Cl- antiporter ClcA|nr:ClC family H(+)/Cl(-) exchange transporter [Coriobacteriales bacterium]
MPKTESKSSPGPAALNINQHKLLIVGKSIFVGALAGAVVSSYRLLFDFAEAGSSSLYALLRANLLLLPLYIVGLAALSLVVNLLLKWAPMATGSGIPQVHGLIIGKVDYPWLRTLLAKFAGGALTVFAGLSVGSSGPSIQMGAAVASGASKLFGRSHTERNILIAAGAAGGLSAAFGAPLAAVIFVFEQILRYLSPVTLLSAIAASVVSDFVASFVFGLQPIFNFAVVQSLPLQDYWILLLLGVTAGLAGAGYTAGLLLMQKVYQKLYRRFKLFSLAPAFLLSLIFAIFLPQVIGSGHDLLGLINPGTGLLFLAVLLVCKYAWSSLAFSSGAPGGIFFPMLVLGALLGAVCGKLALMLPWVSPDLFYNFVILGMVAIFSAIMRTPITGIVLLTEMTGTVTQLLPLTAVALIAYFVADRLRVKPIIDALLEALSQAKTKASQRPGGRVQLHFVVPQGSPLIGRTLEWLWRELPAGVLLIGVRRGPQDLIPQPGMQVQPSDSLLFIAERAQESLKRAQLDEFMRTGASTPRE